MKITIDTQTDTHEEIKKVLQILTNTLEKKDEEKRTLETEPLDAPPTLGMFNSGGPPEPAPEPKPEPEPAPEPEPHPEPAPEPEPEPESAPEIADTPPDFNALLKLTRQKEEEKKEPQVEYF